MKKLIAILMLLSFAAFGKTIELNENNTINFNQAFSMEYVAKKQIEAIKLCAGNIGSTINVVLYTPGGSISAGQLFFDTLKALPCTFDTITVFAASMGYQTVQNLGKRYIIPSGVLMSHRASVSGLSGEIGGELDEMVKHLKDNVTELEVIAANRVGITLNDYRNFIRDELWLTANEAVKKNHADESILVTCDKSLMTTYVETIRTIFGNFEVEFSNCPVIVGPLSVNGMSLESENQFREYFTNITRRVGATL